MVAVMQQDFLPSDDTGRLQGNIQAANGTSYTQMAAYTRQVMKIVESDPVLTGRVLGLANSVTTRATSKPIFEVVGAVILPTLAIVALLLIPFIDRGKMTRVRRRTGTKGIILLSTIFWGGLTARALATRRRSRRRRDRAPGARRRRSPGRSRSSPHRP